MNKTNLAFKDEYNDKSIKHLELSNSIWEYFVLEMKKVFRFTRKETKWFRNCKTAKLIALTMIEGYHKSEQADKKNKVYNPFVSGKWDYEQIKIELEKKIQKISGIWNFDYLNMSTWR